MTCVRGPKATVCTSVVIVLQVGYKGASLGALCIRDRFGPSVPGQNRQTSRETLVHPYLKTVVVCISKRLVARNGRDVGIRPPRVNVSGSRRWLVRPRPGPQFRIFVANISYIEHKTGAK